MLLPERSTIICKNHHWKKSPGQKQWVLPGRGNRTLEQEKGMEKNNKGRVSSTESFGAVDGPGVRFVVFLAGCPMRCRYCHNPETWDPAGGEEMTPQEIFDKAWRYHPYWKNGGGITVSGGEALLQPEFVTELFRIAKKRGVHTTLDTSGAPFTRKEPWFEKFQELMAVTDLVMLDIKAFDPALHKDLTGWDNENILDMARWLSDNGKEMWIRRVLVPGVTDGEEDLAATRRFIESLKNVTKVEVLPYHALGVHKWHELGIPYTLENVSSPSVDECRRAEILLGIRKPSAGENSDPASNGYICGEKIAIA